MRMVLEAQTLLFTAVLASLLMASVHLILWIDDRRQTAPGWTAAATLLCVVSAVLRDVLPDGAAIVLANVVLALGLGCIATACRALAGRDAAPLPLGIPALGWLCACMVPAFMGDQRMRSIVSCLSCAAIMAWSVAELRFAPDRGVKARAVLTAILAVQGIAALARAIVAGLSMSSVPGVLRTADVPLTTYWSFGCLLLIGFAVLFVAREQSERQLRKCLDEDTITGIANRRRFDAGLAAAMERSARQRHPVSLLMVDVDAFKSYNDIHGHVGGDEALQAIAGVLASVAAAGGGLAARWGGEEFAILLPDTDETVAEGFGERACSGVREAGIRHPGAPQGVVTVSVGVATSTPGDGTRAVDLLVAADGALYDAKHAGRNRVRAARRLRTGAIAADPPPDRAPCLGTA